MGIPGFGALIPNLTGLFGPLGPDDGLYWAGYAWFIALAAAIWEGNRWLLFAQRAHWDWFQHPLRKLTFLLAAIVLYTAPVTLLALWGWYAVAPMPLDVNIVVTVTLANTICVAFVTHGYETAFLIRERSDDQLLAERLRRTTAEAELTALRAQVDPHFMFNALNTLAQLIEEAPTKAGRFTQDLAEIYRYLLAQDRRDLVLLREELDFVDRYVGLLKVRFGDGLRLTIQDPSGDARERLLVPPSSLQLLIENVVKHNRIDQEPLEVVLNLGDSEVRVTNPRRPKTSEHSTGVGLANLSERCSLLVGRPLSIQARATSFEVVLPALRLSG